MNYDTSVQNAVTAQTVELTFQYKTHQFRVLECVNGTCFGLTVINSAIEQVYDKLETHPRNPDIAILTLTDEEGNDIIVEDTYNHCEEWLGKMLVSASIISLDDHKIGS